MNIALAMWQVAIHSLGSLKGVLRNIDCFSFPPQKIQILPNKVGVRSLKLLQSHPTVCISETPPDCPLTLPCALDENRREILQGGLTELQAKSVNWCNPEKLQFLNVLCATAVASERR